jgi:hypothetical protein
MCLSVRATCHAPRSHLRWVHQATEALPLQHLRRQLVDQVWLLPMRLLPLVPLRLGLLPLLPPQLSAADNIWQRPPCGRGFEVPALWPQTP